jgi:hypothetical protein
LDNWTTNQEVIQQPNENSFRKEQTNFGIQPHKYIEKEGGHVCLFMKLHKLKKGKAVKHTYGIAAGERGYSSCSFTTSALDGMSGQVYAPAAFYLRYSL